MYAPHTVTVYNLTRDTDKATFETVTDLRCTILRGVFLQATKAANVRATGLEGADAATLYIPFAAEAVDGITGAKKRYAEPKEYWAADDRSELWTLSWNGDGGETFFVKGEFVTDKEGVARAHDGCYQVTKVDAMDYGSADMQHWEVGGV